MAVGSDRGRLLGEPHAIDREQLGDPAPEVAIGLLGRLLVRDLGAEGTAIARIVEVEAYRPDDPASHSYARRTPRCEPMFWQPGTGYVYRSYGVHWCLNVVVEPSEIGAAVLVRAATAIRGVDAVRRRRPKAASDRELLRGPGRLTAGLDIDGYRHDAGDLLDGDAGLWLAADAFEVAAADVGCGPRVGVSRAAEVPWRWWLADAPEVSVYRRSPRAPTGEHRAGDDRPHATGARRSE